MLRELSAVQTEPLGGQPAPGAKASVKDFEEQLAYLRANSQFAIPKSSLSGSPPDGGFDAAESMASNERRGKVFGKLGDDE